jgi:hypothetical protein
MVRLHHPASRALADLAPLLADPTRLVKGRTMQRRGRVATVDVTAGLLTAEVTGSRPMPYEVTIATRAAPAHVGEEVSAGGWEHAVPPARDISFDCTCPDWGDPCKHAVAVLFEFAQMVDDTPELLGRWRGVVAGDGRRAVAPPEPRGAGAGAEVIELGTAVANLADRLKDPALRKAADVILARMRGAGPGAELEGQPSADHAADADPLTDALVAYFTGAMPASGPVLTAAEQLDDMPNPFSRLAISIEGIDAAPVFADALQVVTDHYSGA